MGMKTALTLNTVTATREVSALAEVWALACLAAEIWEVPAPWLLGLVVSAKSTSARLRGSQRLRKLQQQHLTALVATQLTRGRRCNLTSSTLSQLTLAQHQSWTTPQQLTLKSGNLQSLKETALGQMTGVASCTKRSQSRVW